MTARKRNGSGKRQRARSLRQRSPDAEKKLWLQLRNRSLAGYKFRRQHPIGPYVADFACITSRLVVEIDGSQHMDNARDEERTAFIASRGYRVLRFWNNEVLTNTNAVLEAILNELQAPSSPALLPRRGEGSAKARVARIAPSPAGGRGRGEGGREV